MNRRQPLSDKHWKNIKQTPYLPTDNQNPLNSINGNSNQKIFWRLPSSRRIDSPIGKVNFVVQNGQGSNSGNALNSFQ